MVDVATPSLAEASPFTSMAMNGCRRAVEEFPQYRCKYMYSSPDGKADYFEHFSAQLRQDSDVSHIMMVGFAFSAIVERMGKTFPNITFSIADDGIGSTFPTNTQGIQFAEDEAGFLAGVVAASITNATIIGAVGNFPIPPIQRYIYGFMKGAAYVNPNVITLANFNADPTWSNVTLGQSNSADLISKGADVIFGVGGGLGSASIYHAARQRRFVIGVDADEKVTTFANQTDPASQYLLTSAVKRVDQASYYVFKEKAQNSFQHGNKYMNMKNGGRVVISELISTVAARLANGVITTALKTGIHEGFRATSNGTWIPINTVGFGPKELTGHTQTFTFDNGFYIFGGQTSSGVTSNSLYKFTYDNIQWTPVTPSSPVAPPALMKHVAAFRNSSKELFIYGGSQAGNTFNGDVWKFTVATNTWSRVDTVGGGPGRRAFQAFALVNDNDLYVWGGQDEGFNIKDDFWKLDLSTSTWSPIPGVGVKGLDYPEPRFYAHMTVVNGTEILLYGGSDEKSEGQNLWKFSTGTSKWSLINPIPSQDVPAPPALAEMAAVQIDSRRTLFVGGTTRGTSQGKAYIYNAALNQWSIDPKLNFPRRIHGLSAIRFVQSEYANACIFAPANMGICTPSNKTVIVAFGGTEPAQGVVKNLMVVYPDDEVMPRDPQYLPVSIVAVGYAAGGLGLLMSILFLVATALYRKERPFQSASPSFLILYLLGAAMSFVGIILYNAQGTNIAMCHASLWTFSNGCMTLFSAMVVKNWRIYNIFLSKSFSKKSLIYDKQLMPVVIFLVICNIAILVAFTSKSPYQVTTILVDGDRWPLCVSPQMEGWLWILLAPVAMVLVYGLYISFQTRNVNSKYSESAQINMAVYITTLALIVLLSTQLTLKQPTTQHIISSLVICLSLYSVLGVNFLPKILRVMSKNENSSPSYYMDSSNNVSVNNNNSGLSNLSSNLSQLLDLNTASLSPFLPDLPTTDLSPSRSFPFLSPFVLLPLTKTNGYKATVMICGGTRKDQWASKSCSTISPDISKGGWKEEEEMPVGRVMGDAVILPDATVLFVNGAKYGTADGPAGHGMAKDPAFEGVLYNPAAPEGQSKWTILASAIIPRLYHSSALLLPDARVATFGSDQQNHNNRDADPFEYRVEIFSPPYLTMGKRPVILQGVPEKVGYRRRYRMRVKGGVEKVNIVRYSTATHSTNTDQRLVELEITSREVSGEEEEVVVVGMPSNGALAPPGNWMVFALNDKGVPSVSTTCLLG
ncbi:hypothetical protein HDV05_000399 [Chytridiales sp. JEL 0842]|nr:hypothetical protein HDV05_000399 [Chytridiales sp. JEL 0842]